MARTRSTKPAPKEASESSAPDSTSKFNLEAQDESPSRVFILPRKASSKSRIVTLPNPGTSQPSRYLVCPETGIYEFTKTVAPKTTPRSWLIEKPQTLADGAPKTAQVTTSAELFIATSIDPVFLLLPAFVESIKDQAADRKRYFLASDDYFDSLPEEFSHFTDILQCDKTRTLLEARMNAICDTVEAGDETMFRLNENKLASLIMRKAQRMGDAGLPPSMEVKFVKKPLEAPISIQQKTTTIAIRNGSAHGESGHPDGADSQATATLVESNTTSVSEATAATAITEATTEDTFVRAIEATPDVVRLQRLRVAFNFICSSYVPAAIVEYFQGRLSKNEMDVDFGPLDEYLGKVAKLRADAIASRPTDMYSRKHGRDEMEDEMREKKRKLEEEKKKKKESRSIRDLKKVDTTGMMKLSAFFKKK
ncbi:ribonuclease H2, subunit B [Stachybotrys elegans]|uniref:Ribonuclease H2 subunit B n=1 Tax=Stachybotrys elegans TaxID=80388 RepID=A0A8K0SQG1_9HYPO|nr:ribonuclease H2, subunit B [Stachybotrys elegans]